LKHITRNSENICSVYINRVPKLITYLQPESIALNINKQKIHSLKATSRMDVLVNGASVINAHAHKDTSPRKVFPSTVVCQSLKIARRIEGRSNTSVLENKRV